MWNAILKLIDWFVPEAAKRERSELGLARNFVFLHLFGPLLGQSIVIFLFLTDPQHNYVFWTMMAAIDFFWILPFALKWTKNLQMVSVFTVQVLAFASLFGSFHYGGVSSPLLPWLLIALLLGFFYLGERPLLVLGMFAGDLLAFYAAYAIHGSFDERVPLAQLSNVGWISIFSATVYMSWMAIYYVSTIALRSDLEKEADRHRATAIRLRQAKEQAERANLSRIETNAVALSLETFELPHFIEHVASTAQPLVTQNGNKLVIKPMGQLGEMTADTTKLRQIVLNLLSNAAKFTTDGEVTLSVRRDEKPGGDWIELRVEDTGIGIAEEDLPKLFQDFGQVSASTSSKYGGTGLGLAVSQKLCALMGGGISVTSEVGHGSCFLVRLPAIVTIDETAVEALETLESLAA
jgi:signal transduction histidine kinase